MANYNHAAIIGFYNNGMPLQAISVYSGIPDIAVQQILNNYLQQQKQKLSNCCHTAATAFGQMVNGNFGICSNCGEGCEYV